jgi:hypothetical protein
MQMQHDQLMYSLKSQIGELEKEIGTMKKDNEETMTQIA